MSESDEPLTLYVPLAPHGAVYTDCASLESESDALRRLLETFLLPKLFGVRSWGQTWGGGVLYYLWRDMEAHGWRVARIVLDKTLDALSERSKAGGGAS